MTSYVRAMEAQQHKLEAAVHTMYYRLLAVNAWPGPRLIERDGNPLIHDVLAVLGLLESVDDQRNRLDREQPEIEETQHGSPSGDGLLVESAEEQHRERRNSTPTQSRGAYHSRNQSNQSVPLVPEESRWFGDVPGLLPRTATGAHSLITSRRSDFVPAASSFNKSCTPAANDQQQSHFLPASTVQQQAFIPGQSSQSAARSLPGSEAMNWNFSNDSTAWWYDDQDTLEQQVSVAMESSGDPNGPCELDGLWQSARDNNKGIPQSLPPDDDQMDRELPSQFFKVGW